MKLEEESKSDIMFEYDDEDDVSIRSLFSSMESVNEDFEDESSCSEDECSEAASNSTQTSCYSNRNESKNSITHEFKISNLNQVQQKPIKPTLKLPFISSTNNAIKNEKMNVQPQNSLTVNVNKPSQPIQHVKPVKVQEVKSVQVAPVAIQSSTNNNSQNRFIIAVPSLNPSRNLYEKIIVKKLAPVSVQVNDEKPKIIHHQYFYNPQPIKNSKSKQQQVSIVTDNYNEKNIFNKNNDKVLPNENGSKFLKFIKKNYLSSSEIDLNVSSRVFTFNEVTLKKI